MYFITKTGLIRCKQMPSRDQTQKKLHQKYIIHNHNMLTNVDMMVELGLVLRPVEGEGQGDEPLPGKQGRPISRDSDPVF